jgi:hypothetical protein
MIVFIQPYICRRVGINITKRKIKQHSWEIGKKEGGGRVRIGLQRMNTLQNIESL